MTENEIHIVPDLDKDPIYREEMFSREQGSVVRFTNINDESDIRFSGRAMIQARTPQGIVPMPFNFEFPSDVKTITEAFSKFKDTLMTAIQEEQRKQQQTIVKPPPGSSIEDINNIINKPGDNHGGRH